MKILSKLTYANVVATLALVLAVSGGVAYAASKIQTKDIAPGAVKTNQIFKRAVVSGKLAVGAVRTNQIADGAIDSARIQPGAVTSTRLADGAVDAAKIADGAVGSTKIANGSVGSTKIAAGAVGSAQIQPGSVTPADQQFPVSFVANPTGGPASVPPGAENTAYPLSGATWTQDPGQVDVIFGGTEATLAYDGKGEGECRVEFGIFLNGQQVGGGSGPRTESTTPETLQATLGAGTELDPPKPVTNQMTVQITPNGHCTAQSRIDSSRFRVLDFG